MRPARLGDGRYIAPADLPEPTRVTAHELRTSDGATVSGLLRTVPGATTVAFLMHPRQDFSHHVLVPELLHHGFAVWTQGSRSVGNDLSLLHEQALLDMAAGHVFLRESGFESVLSVGHSGGAALAAFYLQQAALAPGQRVQATPGGKSVPLGEAEMPLADGLALMAPHPGQGALLQRVIDPSVTDESDPLSVDPSLDPYNPDNGFAPAPQPSSYTVEFIESYRAAQQARIARIDSIAFERVESARNARRRYAQTKDPADRRTSLASGVIVVHRTDADLRAVDPRLDPNDRPYGSLFGHRPDLTNYGIVGFGRLTTPEAWLSTWSANTSRADLAACAPGVPVPTLVVELTGDQACFPDDAKRFASLFGHEDVSLVRTPGRHFGAPLHEGMSSGATLAGREISRWAGERFPSEAFLPV
ncbi:MULTISPECIES: alpha/beta hydrolase [unclassified Nocardioides]|uniref:alpha/beta hydrolase n=1 Tax=unclassified Nocardioides TaxID=2615069 RepID=UPI0006F81894|nr:MULTISPECIES: alpha/beta hydrolase [unclassified Nocardioides]KQY55497.1 alpha/beta hydrolase [Nocardioides sp. Root140]KRF12766.1 alpha/beta hydrolase [Nocardioides sp. Soil796]